MSEAFNEVNESVNLLTSAQKLYDEHVSEGIKIKERLIKEGEEKRDTLLEEANNIESNLLTELKARNLALVEAVEKIRELEESYLNNVKKFLEEQQRVQAEASETFENVAEENVLNDEVGAENLNNSISTEDNEEEFSENSINW